ncbi:hypothetical protein VTN77DRAFT_6598 [Rasamsonia byssochlamydoides]|uniref:uncharacterized protein n=1 Tax=Rasamsonia byssochlamydoides TaxID=89139 RepID=UPI003742C21F
MVLSPPNSLVPVCVDGVRDICLRQKDAFPTLSALSFFFSSALALTITSPTSGNTLDFSTPQTIKFDSKPGDPQTISIILIQPSSNWQTKIADNVQVSQEQYTTQPNPSVPNSDGYKIELIDRSGALAESDSFTVQKD